MLAQKSNNVGGTNARLAQYLPLARAYKLRYIESPGIKRARAAGSASTSSWCIRSSSRIGVAYDVIFFFQRNKSTKSVQ